MDMYGSSLESFGHLPFDINYAAETTGDYYAMFADQAQTEEEAIGQASHEMPQPEADPCSYSGLPTTLPAGVDTWSGAAAQAPEYLAQVAVESYPNYDFVQQPIPDQQPAVPQQHIAPHHPGFPVNYSGLPATSSAGAETWAQAPGYLLQAAVESYPNHGFVQQPAPDQQLAVPQQYFAPHQPGFPVNYSGLPMTLSAGIETWAGAAAQAPQYLPQAAVESYPNYGFVQQPAPDQQPAVPQQYFVPPSIVPQPIVPHQQAVHQHNMAPQQPIAFQQRLVPEQSAPQTVTDTAPAAPSAAAASVGPVVPAALAAPKPAVASSKPPCSTVSAIHVFEANVMFSEKSRSAGLCTWKDVANAIANPNLVKIRKSKVYLMVNWDEPMIYMGKQDFRAYYRRQHRLGRVHAKHPLPPIPGWVPGFALNEKDLVEQRGLNTRRAVAQILLKKSLRGSGSGSKDKGKGKARVTPYTHPDSSLRPSPLGRS